MDSTAASNAKLQQQADDATDRTTAFNYLLAVNPTAACNSADERCPTTPILDVVPTLVDLVI